MRALERIELSESFDGVLVASIYAAAGPRPRRFLALESVSPVSRFVEGSLLGCLFDGRELEGLLVRLLSKLLNLRFVAYIIFQNISGALGS